MKHFYTILTLFLTVYSYGQLTPPTELQAYYNDVDFTTTGTTLFDDLAIETIAKHTNILDYSERHDYLYDADEDLTLPTPSNVILMYTGESRSDDEWLSGSNPNPTQTFNTEHVYPQSLIGNTARGDLHHLRTCDITINSNRGNDPFADVAVPSGYQDLGNSWFPGDEWKGDVARMIMYLNLRYDEPFNDVGTLALFLEWNAEDPVSDFEDNRQSIIAGAQGNRNPFIDNPYIATVIWGGTPAENRWTNLSVDEFSKKTIRIYPNPLTSSILTIETNTNTNYKIYDILGKQVLSGKVSQQNNKVNTQSLNKGVYILKLETAKGKITKKLIKS
ncbi:endonuclease [uncultured Lacinutrix sp.]|uniref:endonuclease n=1 Tax=uncultured Lacinutrix sp. TaxID=574032 RepID=UPI002634092F|nr:endonuclease [uncultured Lacinutrix sp.]